MELTGACKKEFEKWYVEVYCVENGYERDYILLALSVFYLDTPSEQYGVLVDYFDSVGIYIEIFRNASSKLYLMNYTIKGQSKRKCLGVRNKHFTRPEARTQAILKADDLRNEQLKK